MKVTALQQYLRSLEAPLRESGAAQKILTDLEQTSLALEPFREFDFGQLAVLLGQADEYRRTGVLPMPASKGRTRAPAAPKVLDQAKIQQLAQSLRQLEERATQPEVSVEVLEAELEKLGLKKLGKPEAVALANEVGIETNSKLTKDAAVKKLYRTVLDRKEALESMKV